MMQHPINFAGRFEFLEAIQRHAPRVLAQLAADAFPPYMDVWVATPLDQQNDLMCWERLRSRTGTGEEKVLAALEKWPNAFFAGDEWIYDAAVQTISAWTRQAIGWLSLLLYPDALALQFGETLRLLQKKCPELTWHYFPRELPTPGFQARIRGMWVPEHSPWVLFRRTLRQQLTEQLEAYRREVERIWGRHRPSLTRHADWAALWQSGKSPTAIQNWHYKEHHADLTEAAIQKAVHEFAIEIGLTLRPPKAGKLARKA